MAPAVVDARARDRSEEVAVTHETLQRHPLRVSFRLVKRLGLALGGLYTFVFGIFLMKQTAGEFAQAFPGFAGFVGGDPWRALGLGWMAAYAVLSGSPIAAATLGLLHADIIPAQMAYMMIMGSRLGAAIITLILGLIAWLARGQDRFKSLAIGVLSFVVTYTIYGPAILLGYLLMSSGLFSWLTFQAPAPVLETTSTLLAPLVMVTLAAIPASLHFGAFLLAFGSIYVGFYLFDAAFYREEVAEIKRSRIHNYLRNPLFSFMLGALVTLVAESVSLSLGILVPLFLRGDIDEEEVIPYIVGANITTFIDTLLAALLFNDPAAVNVVVIEIICVAVVSALAMRFYRRYQGMVLRTFDFILDHDVALGSFVVGLIAAPILVLRFL